MIRENGSLEASYGAKPMAGDKLYQIRAREALPILVRQAGAEEPITYENIAAELGMANPRNLNYVLGSIGQTLIGLGKSWKEDVPPIQCLVVNKGSGLPGEGISEFLGTLADYKRLSRRQRRQLVDAELAKIYGYPFWSDVLESLDLTPAPMDFTGLIEEARQFRAGGEGPAHKALKAYVSKNPQLVGLPAASHDGYQEYALPSGDFVDVLFEHRGELIGVEVKPASSGDADITRGLYQCVKYQAVMEAVQASTGRKKNVRTVLLLQGKFPRLLVGLKNILGIEVISQVKIPEI